MLNRGRYLRFAIMLPDGSWMRAAVNVEERLPELIAHIQKMHASASAWKQCRDEKLSKVFFDECTEILRVVLGAGELKRAAALCGGAAVLFFQKAFEDTEAERGLQRGARFGDDVDGEIPVA